MLIVIAVLLALILFVIAPVLGLAAIAILFVILLFMFAPTLLLLGAAALGFAVGVGCIIGLWERHHPSTDSRTADQMLAENEYRNGINNGSNPTEAERWFRTAAEKGHTGAQYELGNLYSNHGTGRRGLFGRVEPGAMIEAYKWYSLAAAADEFHGVWRRDELARRMTREQIAAADGLVREWEAEYSSRAA